MEISSSIITLRNKKEKKNLRELIIECLLCAKRVEYTVCESREGRLLFDHIL
jgi:hypothetical protein